MTETTVSEGKREKRSGRHDNPGLDSSGDPELVSELRRILPPILEPLPVGLAYLYGYRLHFCKWGRDGSGKCGVATSAYGSDVLPGVLYQIDAAEQAALDRAEGLGNGYELAWERIRCHGRLWREAFFYMPTRIDESLRPWSWYRDLVLAGARQNGLPRYWRRRLLSVRCWSDPELSRLRKHRKLLM